MTTARTKTTARVGAGALAAAALLSLSAVGTAAPAYAIGAGSASEGMEWVTGDPYHKITFDHHLKPSDSERWEGRCPAAFPYLDKRVVPSGMGGSPHGFTVNKETDWLAIGEGAFVRSYTPVSGSPGWDYVTGTAGSVTNWSVTHQHLRVQMTCTSSPANGWMVY